MHFKSPAIALCCVFILTTTNAHAQDSDLPPKPTRTPFEAEKEAKELQKAEKAELFNRLEAMWIDANEPRMVLLCGVPRSLSRCQTRSRNAQVIIDGNIGRTDDGDDNDSDQHTARSAGNKGSAYDAGPLTSGVFTPAQYVGADIVFYDPTGFAPRIESTVSGTLSDAGKHGIQLTSIQAAAEKDSSLMTTLQNNGEGEAILAAIAEQNAEYGLSIRISPIPMQNRDDPPMMNVIVKIHRIGKGTAVASHSFDFKAGMAGKFARKYSDAISQWFAEKLIREFERRNEITRTEVRLLATQIDMFRRLEQNARAKKIRGVKKLNLRSNDQTDGVYSFLFDIKHEDSSFNLYFSLADYARKYENANLDFLSQADGKLTLRFEPIPPEPAAATTRSGILADPEDRKRDAIVERLAKAYVKQGKPKIAVVVNQELAFEEIQGLAETELKDKLPEHWNSYYYLRTLGTAPKHLRPATGHGMDTTQVTAAMYGILKTDYADVGLDLRDAKHARSAITKAAKREGALMGDAEYDDVLRNSDVSKILIDGTVRVDRARNGQVQQYVCAFRAIDLANAAILASMTSTVPIESARNENDLNSFVRLVAGELMDQILLSWDRPEKIDVQIREATDAGTLELIRSEFENIPGVRGTGFEDQNDRVSRFWVEHDTGIDPLRQWLEQKQGSLPFEIDEGEATRNTIMLKVRPSVLASSKK